MTGEDKFWQEHVGYWAVMKFPVRQWIFLCGFSRGNARMWARPILDANMPHPPWEVPELAGYIQVSLLDIDKSTLRPHPPWEVVMLPVPGGES